MKRQSAFEGDSDSDSDSDGTEDKRDPDSDMMYGQFYGDRASRRRQQQEQEQADSSDDEGAVLIDTTVPQGFRPMPKKKTDGGFFSDWKAMDGKEKRAQDITERM